MEPSMSRRPEGLSLDDELMVRKGEARGIGPAAAIRTQSNAELPPAHPAVTPLEPTPGATPRLQAQPIPEDPPIVIGKRQTIERVFTNVRIPVELDERLYRMMVETRRKKQDIIEGFIRAGLDHYESRRRRAG
jgi:hypothetical protein